MARYSERARPSGRGSGGKAPRPVFWLFCEGEVTEPQYFKALTQGRQIQLQFKQGGAVPKTLVERAIKHRGDNPEGQTWCVFDRDEHPEIAESCQRASAKGVEVAYSNPCFELWLLLHFQERPGAMHRHALQTLLQRHLPSYTPERKHVDFERLRGGVAEAERRAERIEREAQGRGDWGHECNPQTSVYKLTRALRA